MKVRTYRRVVAMCAFIALLGFLVISHASAGTILNTPAPLVSGPGLGFAAVPAIVTVNPNNDNQSGGGPLDNNIVVPLKRFNSNEPIDIVFSVDASDGVTEYLVSEFVDNNTGVPWVGYRMLLGFGSGVGFSQVAAPDGLDFDAPTYDAPPRSLPFSTIAAPIEDTLVFSGGSHASGAQLYRFRLGVSDITGLLSPDARTFTLRQIPVPIPEPASVVLVGLAALIVAAARQR